MSNMNLAHSMLYMSSKVMDFNFLKSGLEHAAGFPMNIIPAAFFKAFAYRVKYCGTGSTQISCAIVTTTRNIYVIDATHKVSCVVNYLSFANIPIIIDNFVFTYCYGPSSKRGFYQLILLNISQTQTRATFHCLSLTLHF